MVRCSVNHLTALFRAGVLPLLSPFNEVLTPDLLKQVDGIVLTGSSPGGVNSVLCFVSKNNNIGR